MSNKIKVLRIISTLNPQQGGPAKAIIDNSLAMINQNIKVDILTCDRASSKFYKSKYINIINQGPSFFGNFSFSYKWSNNFFIFRGKETACVFSL